VAVEAHITTLTQGYFDQLIAAELIGLILEETSFMDDVGFRLVRFPKVQPN